jgi:molybdopterin synthase catalytic subunit
VVATTAAHRGEAFAASRTLIDTLKDEVPIWKHQQFTDGTDEWVGTP